MNKPIPQNTALQELWAVKDATAKRFKSAAEYFEYLQSSPELSPSLANLVPKPALKVQRAKAVRVW